ncbi:MAG: Ppx/GppA family phosphatase [Euryarchaeota archaeon]|nr:Ppx/GppA family phosphatase [Euryarchaeota archaeon]
MDAADEEVVGFIDIGTNSVHILVVKYYEGSMGITVFQDKEVIRLGQSLYAKGYIDRETIEKARLVISNFAETARIMGAKRIITRATCAAREAVNKKELVDALRADGIEVCIIPGYEEARLIRLGIFGPVAPDENTLAIDIGGGSTEVILCRGEEDIFLDSLSMGSVRFAYGCGVPTDRALSFAEYDYLRREVDLRSNHTCRVINEHGFATAYGSSGTLIALADMCAAKRGDGDSSYMMYYELVELMKDIYSRDIVGRCDIPRMNPVRADIIVAGGAIAEELMYLLNIDRIEISPNGLKQGLQIDYMLKQGHRYFDVREASVRGLAARCGYDRRHADFVRRFALELFDGTKGLALHDIGDETRDLLAYASTLHDIGEFINYNKHHIHSYIIITNSNLGGFTTEELKYIGMIARFHHKRFPSEDSKVFGGLSSGRRKQLRMCALMLKMADILDRRHTSSLERIDVSLEDGTLVLGLRSDMDMSMEIWKLTSIEADIEDVFGLELRIDRI